MADQFLEHKTVQGERWDTLAWHYYGDASRIDGIIASNPAIPITATFGPGTLLLIPIISAAAATTTDLPPWL